MQEGVSRLKFPELQNTLETQIYLGLLCETHTHTHFSELEISLPGIQSFKLNSYIGN